MNNTWKTLIIVGIISLFLATAWEVFQISSGGRIRFTQTVLELNRSNLFSASLESHLESDPEYQRFSAGLSD